MSIKVQTYIWRIPMPPTAKLVAIALADHAHDDGTEARPSQALLIEKTGLSKGSIRRAIGYLLEQGIIYLDRPAAQHRANVYGFCLPDTSPRGSTGVPLSNPQRSQTNAQRVHHGPSEGPPRTPNHKNHHLNQASADEQAETERARTIELNLYGHVLSVTERARLMRCQVLGQPFVPDANLSE
jgi:hypothetical protein